MVFSAAVADVKFFLKTPGAHMHPSLDAQPPSEHSVLCHDCVVEVSRPASHGVVCWVAVSRGAPPSLVHRAGHMHAPHNTHISVLSELVLTLKVSRVVSKRCGLNYLHSLRAT